MLIFSASSEDNVDDIISALEAEFHSIRETLGVHLKQSYG
jgi:hypothetical protein